MKQYKVIVEEIVYNAYLVEANSEEEAISKYHDDQYTDAIERTYTESNVISADEIQ